MEIDNVDDNLICGDVEDKPNFGTSTIVERMIHSNEYFKTLKFIQISPNYLKTIHFKLPGLDFFGIIQNIYFDKYQNCKNIIIRYSSYFSLVAIML